jgi:hypothetical protein
VSIARWNPKGLRRSTGPQSWRATLALVKKVVFVTEVLPILWTGIQPFNRGERFPSAASTFHRPSFLSFFPVPYFFCLSPRFYRKISRQDRLRATSPDSVDP